MSIIAIIPDPQYTTCVVEWAFKLADENESVEFLCFESEFDGHSARSLEAVLKEKDKDAEPPTIIDHPAPVSVILNHVKQKEARMFITAPFSLPTVEGREQTSHELVETAPCQTFSLLSGTKLPSDIKHILFVATAGVHNRAAVSLVENLRQRLTAKVTISYIEDQTGAEPGQYGTSTIQSLLHDTDLDEKDYHLKVITDRLKHRGILSLLDQHDLIITGWDYEAFVRPLKQSLGETAVALVKRLPPLRRRGTLADLLPRINPGDHADLMLNLRMGSEWGADFIGMLGLAAAIATLGLLQNSPAVVIGSMLLAPLMTPMIGLGLALGQAHDLLARICGKSILLGFLLTLIVSMVVAGVTPSGETLSDEVLSRGGPNVLDLFIAVFAAAAATYSMARPNITGTLAGVAIATALVPPICSIGVSLAHGAFLNALGATVLFSTNLIAIIVTSSFVFSMMGITSARSLRRHQRIAEGGRLTLLALLIVLVGPLSSALIKQIDEGKNVSLARPVTHKLHDALYERVARDEGVEIMFLARPRAENNVMIHIASREDLPTAYGDELEKIVRNTMNDPDVKVTVVAVRGIWRRDSEDN